MFTRRVARKASLAVSTGHDAARVPGWPERRGVGDGVERVSCRGLEKREAMNDGDAMPDTADGGSGRRCGREYDVPWL